MSIITSSSTTWPTAPKPRFGAPVTCAVAADVVIKFPTPHTLEIPTLTARWRREVELTEGLSHPGLQCRVDVGERHREPMMVLEYASGGSLRRWLTDAGEPLPIGQVIEWGRELAEGLAFLHQLGVVHRDVKPDNLLVTDDLTVKLGDFGSAVIMRQGESWWRRWLRITDPPEGTPGYMSPEQILGQRGDQRTDVYSWGVLMYELLTGRRPFEGDDDLSTVEAQLTAQPIALHVLRPDVPPALEVVVMKAMRRRPEERFPSALALLEALDHLDGPDGASLAMSDDPPLSGTTAVGEGVDVLRLIAVVFVGFVSFVTVVIAASVAFR